VFSRKIFQFFFQLKKKPKKFVASNLKLNTFANFEKMAEKVNITFQQTKKKVPKGQFLKASRNWQKCSALESACKNLVGLGGDRDRIVPSVRLWKDHLKNDLR
jgi:hypothetical protein